MKMGIERVLRENFINLGKIIADQPEEIVQKVLTIELVETAIGKVLPAVKSLGGTVEITSVESGTGVVNVRYKGPPKLIQGLKVILKENELVKDVIVEVVL
jgi:hypothetical protein